MSIHAMVGAALVNFGVIAGHAAHAQCCGPQWRDDGSFAPAEAALLNRPIATPPLAGTPWLITRTPPVVGNGRLWEGPVIIGRAAPRPTRVWPDRSPESFGADLETSLANTRVLAIEDGLVISLSPWTHQNGETLPQRAAARRFWLREQGFTGGVRTFRNPRTRIESEAAPAERVAPEPAARIRIPPRSFDVRGLQQARISTPPGMAPDAAARLKAIGQTRIADRD